MTRVVPAVALAALLTLTACGGGDDVADVAAGPVGSAATSTEPATVPPATASPDTPVPTAAPESTSAPETTPTAEIAPTSAAVPSPADNSVPPGGIAAVPVIENRPATAAPGDPFCAANEGHSFSSNEIANEFANYPDVATAQVGIERYRTEIEERFALAPADIADYMTPFYQEIVLVTDLARAVGYDYAQWDPWGPDGLTVIEGAGDSADIYRYYVSVQCDQEIPSDTLPGGLCDDDPTFVLCAFDD